MFYTSQYTSSSASIILDEDSSRHIVQVLRKTKGDKIELTDGKGHIIESLIQSDHRKHCEVQVISVKYQEPTKRKVIVAVSLVKNSSRFEWFLEKATEIGISEIIPLICARTEKEKFRHDRLHAILVSAMIQSQQCWLPTLHQPINYELLFRQEEVARLNNKFIAHCIDSEKKGIVPGEIDGSSIILIGPEGDFTEAEIEMALANEFVPVTLGETRLRTETAALVATTLLRMF